MANGKIHSIETMGAVDGPGIRTVVFMQGCKLRCVYCHNPDTWALNSSEITMSPRELLSLIVRYRPYYGTLGGVTFSGGEPLLQADFLIEMLSLCKQENIHTCIDTAGFGIGKYEEILKYTDLVLLDIKHYDDDAFKEITGQLPTETVRFINTLKKVQTPVWLRHVVVPTLTDNIEHLDKIEKYYVNSLNVQRIEFLPYHTLGVSKYAKMGLAYPLKGVPPLSADSLKERNDRLITIKNNNEKFNI